MSENGDRIPLKGRGFRLRKTTSAQEATVSTTVEDGRFQRRLSAAKIIALAAGKASRPLTQGLPIPSRLAISS